MPNDSLKDIEANSSREALQVLGEDSYQDFRNSQNFQNSMLLGLNAFVHSLFGHACDLRF